MSDEQSEFVVDCRLCRHESGWQPGNQGERHYSSCSQKSMRLPRCVCVYLCVYTSKWRDEREMNLLNEQANGKRGSKGVYNLLLLMFLFCSTLSH